MSARILGSAFGVTAQEMNALLKEGGFLDGAPGAYSVTEKGEKYADEQDHHRGTGGYGWYNRGWTTRTWDESIANELDVTDDKKQQIRQQVAEARRAAKAPEPAVEEEIEPQAQDDLEHRGFDLRPVLIVGGVIAAGIGIYKAVPRINRFVNEKVAPRFRKTKTESSKPEKVDDESEDAIAELNTPES